MGEEFAKAAFVFGSTSLTFNTNIKEPGNDLKYIIKVTENHDGTKTYTPDRVENLKFSPSKDNFNFESDDIQAYFANYFLGSLTDPNGIGKVVDLTFIDGKDQTYAKEALTITKDEFNTYSKKPEESFDFDNCVQIISNYLAYFKKMVDSDVFKYDAEGKYLIYGDREDNKKIHDTVTKTDFDLSSKVYQNSLYRSIFDTLLATVFGMSTQLSQREANSLALFAESEIDRLFKDGHLNPHADRLSNGIIYLLGGGADTATGTDKDDTLIDGGGSDTIYGDKGDDIIFAGNRGEDKSKDDGSDISSNTLYGGAGNDRLYDSSGDDTIYADTDKYYIFVGDQDELDANFDDTNTTNYLYGNSGGDTLIGSKGIDYLYADSEEFKDKATNTNTLVGKEGDDHIFGGNK